MILRMMADEPDNLVVSLLRDMRAGQQRMEGKLDELVRRVDSREANVAQLHVDMASHSARMDRIDARLDRIEKRLNLVDA